MEREHLIALATSDPYYMKVCRKASARLADDLFQEICMEVLTMPADRLPLAVTFRSFWYRCAFNMVSKTGKVGKTGHREVSVDTITSLRPVAEHSTPESLTEKKLRKLEEFMLSLPEFDNRVALLYNELGDLKKVQRATGISYSALRYVKEKIKAARI